MEPEKLVSEPDGRRGARGYSSLDLIDLQLRLEGIEVTPNGRLRRAASPSPDEIPGVIVFRHSGTYTMYVHQELPEDAARLVASHAPEKVFAGVSGVDRVEGLGSPTRFSSFVVPDVPPCSTAGAIRLTKSDAELVDAFPGHVDLRWAAFGVLVDGVLASVCESSREDDRAAEAWVQTAPAFRRGGHARTVIHAWARDRRREGRVPFYSHVAGNVASAAVASRMGMHRVAVAAAYPLEHS